MVMCRYWKFNHATTDDDVNNNILNHFNKIDFYFLWFVLIEDEYE